MTLTKRGDTAVGVAIMLTCALLVVGAYWVGQAWKQDRLQNQHRSLTCQTLGVKECAR